MRLTLLQIALIGIGLLTGCSSQMATPSAALDPHHTVALPAPAMTPGFYRQQLLTVTLPRQQGAGQSLLTVLEVSGKGIVLVGLTPLGVRLFAIEYDESGIRSEQLPALSALGALPPINQVLADVMLSYWPIARWQPLLPAGWTLADRGLRRELRDAGGQLVSEIHYRQMGAYREPVRLWHHLFGYQLQIQTLATAADPPLAGKVSR